MNTPNRVVKYLYEYWLHYLAIYQFQSLPNTYAIVSNNANQQEQEGKDWEKPVARRMKIKFETRRHWQPKLWK